MNKFKLFFIWQDDKEEAWLNDLSAKGQRLDSVSFPFTYHFSSDASKKYTSSPQHTKRPGTSQEAFKETFQKSGWEHIGRMNGWHYFQKEVSGEMNRFWTGAKKPKRANIKGI